jgi:hypothetical protein
MIAWGTVVLMASVVVTLFLCRHRIATHLVLAGGERAIAKHIVTPVDMTARYMVPASQFDSLQTLGWRSVPSGFQVYAHVPFNVDGLICLWGGRSAKGGLVLPEADPDIAVNQKFQTLYVYHAAFFASPDNTPVYDVVFHYADGSSATNQVLYGAGMPSTGMSNAAGTPRGQPARAPRWAGKAGRSRPEKTTRCALPLRRLTTRNRTRR